MKRHELRSAIRSFLLALPVLCFAAATVLAQSTPSPARNPNASVSQETRALAQASGMSADQVRQRLRDMGMSDEEIDRDLAASTPRPRSTAATAAPAAPEPPIPAETLAPNTPAPAASASEPFGFEIFRYSPTTFEPLQYGPVDPDYPLGPGDELVLTLWGDDQMTLTLPVSREGFVTLPDVGQVSVNGVTLEEARVRIRSALSRVYSGLRAGSGRATTFLSVSTGRLRTIQVFLLGQVVRPGSYTLSSVSRILNALYAAGGPARDGSLRDVRILRGNQQVASVDLYDIILGGASQQMLRLENGDVIFVPAAERRVTLAGPVRRAGIYELRHGEQLGDLLRISGGLLPEADVERAQVNRIVPPALRDSLRGQGRVAIDVNLSSVLAGAAVAMYDGDSLTVFSVPDRRANTVSINGRGIGKPGVYEFRAGMRVSDLIAAAGGVTPDAYLDRAQVTRTLPDSTRAALRFVPGRALAGDAAEDLMLNVLDDVSIRSKWDLQERQPVSVHGLVRSPGTYELLEGMTLTDLLMKAGGLTDDALASSAEVARVSVTSGGQEITQTLRVPLTRDLTRAGEAAAMRLEPHDAVFIRRDPDFREQEYVTVVGEVRFPGTYSLTRRDERLSELVTRAGGLTPLAYAKGASFLRQGSARLAIDLPGALKQRRGDMDLVLLKGDTLRVPRFTPTVQVEGAVLNPVTALYQPGAGVGFYLTQASGLREDADRRAVVVISPSGRVRKGGKPEPGSRIIVPARTNDAPKDHLKDFATLMSILASAATTVYLVGQSTK